VFIPANALPNHNSCCHDLSKAQGSGLRQCDSRMNNLIGTPPAQADNFAT
jgi:hypothetical protein